MGLRRNRPKSRARAISRQSIVALLALLWAGSAEAQDGEQPPDGQPPGSEGPDIVVNGIRQPAAKLFDTFLPNIPFVSGQYIFVDEPEGGTVRNQHQCTRKNAVREAGTDQAATEVEAMIKDPSREMNVREYSSVIIGNFLDPNNPSFRTGEIMRGESWAEAAAAGRDVPQTVLRVPQFQMYDRIVAVEHSHPRQGIPDFDINKLPSDKDWEVYNRFLEIYGPSRVAPAYAFSHYIIGPDGVMRQYRQDGGRPTRPTTGVANRC